MLSTPPPDFKTCKECAMNRFAVILTVSTLLLLASFPASALVSLCGSNDTSRMASHVVNLNWYESTIVNVLEWESALVGPKSLTLEDRFGNASILALHIFYPPLPYGSYSLTGTARLYTSELGEWEQFSGSRCSIMFDFPEPEFCETTAPIFSSSRSVSGDVATKIDSAFSSAVNGKFFSCSSLGSVSFSSELTFSDVDQCYEEQESNESGTSFGGSVSVSVPGLSCSTPNVSVPVAGVPGVVYVNFSASLSGSASVSTASTPDLCNDTNTQGTVSGSISGSISASATAYVLHPSVISATGGGSVGLSASVSGSSVSNLNFSGCAGPISVTGSITVLDGTDSERSVGFTETIDNSTICI